MPDNPRAQPESGWWRAVQTALRSWAGTARLCLITLTVNVPADVMVWLIRR